ncbi:MAG: hypothetical protein ABFD89_05235 [Bryobacteraceae bacterium]
MNPITITKRFVLQAILAAGTGMSEPLLEDACRAVQPALLLSDFRQALRELQSGGLIVGDRNELSEITTWGLTAEGRLRAKQL